MSTSGSNSSVTWQRLCGTPDFRLLRADGRFLSPCCQALAVDVPVAVLYLLSAALVLDRALSLPVQPLRSGAALAARLWLSLWLAAAAVARLVVVAVLSDRLGAAAALSPALVAVAWLAAALVTAAVRSRLSCSVRGPPALQVQEMLLLLLGGCHLAGSVVAFTAGGLDDAAWRLAVALLACDSVYVAVAAARLLTLLPGESARTDSAPLLVSELLVGPEPPLGVAEDAASWPSRLTFWWAQPLMRRGRRRRLAHVADLHRLPRGLTTDRVDGQFAACLRRRAAASARTLAVDADTLIPAPPSAASVSLLGVMLRCFGGEYLVLGVLKLVADLASFAGPLLLNAIITFIKDPQQPMSKGYIYAGLICAANIVSAICITQYDYGLAKIGLKIRASFVMTIYRKVLDVPLCQLGRVSSGEVLTYMSVDTDRVVNLAGSFHAFWSLPFQFGVTLYLLYWQVGKAFLSGLAFAIALVPFNKWIADRTGRYSAGMLQHKDDRVKLTEEVLQGIRTVKFSGWERFFTRVIGCKRDLEVKFLAKQKYLDAWCVFFWATTPVLMCLLTFGTYVLLGNQLTAATVFTTIALLNMLKGPINAYPWALNGLVDSLVSIRRVKQLLALADIDREEYFCGPRDLPAEDAECDVVIRRGCFHWGESAAPASAPAAADDEKTEDSLTSLDETMSDLVCASNRAPLRLWDVTLRARRGQLVAVTGPVGAGKSSLMLALLGELVRDQGEVLVADGGRGVGYVSQQPWLQQASVRDNILFGSAYEADRYRAVLAACALTADLDSLPAGDMTELTQNGANLSGGQRARVALARAVYQNLPVYLLDDIFSSLDARVAAHVMSACVRRLLRRATVLLCGHQVALLKQVDWLLMLEKGRIVAQGRPSDLLPEETAASDRPQSPADDSPASSDSSEGAAGAAEVEEEDQRVGAVSLPVYKAYYGAIGRCLAPFILATVALMQASSNATDLWLGYYVRGRDGPGPANASWTEVLGIRLQGGPVPAPPGDERQFFQVYGSIAALNALLALLRSFLFAYGGIRAARVVHDRLLGAVLRAELAFFAANPVGRIVNRFSSDLFTVDSSLPFILNILLAQFAGLTGFVVVTVISLPWVGLLLLPLGLLYYYIQNFYRYTSRELKRISTVALSPVYVHFVETLSGLACVRALRGRDRMILEMTERVEASQRARFATQASVSWLGFRLQLIGVAMVTGVALIAVFKHHAGVEVHAGLVGLAISCALSVTGLLSGLVSSFTETEKEMVSMERLYHYMTSGGATEHGQVRPPPPPPADWPEQGAVTFLDVTLRYRDSPRPALSLVSFSLEPGTSLGVVGRTGSGKSSLLAALFRMHPICGGAILLDDVDIRHVSADRLREGLSVIPQEPFVFSGTVRQNLDPGALCSDAVIWAALTECHLRPVIGSLEMELSEGGGQLSQGQRQLLCLARALLRPAQVVCLDEATANLDPETDRLIQATLQECFRGRTLISVGHRLSAVSWCDQVLVLSGGEAVELAPPQLLLSDPASALSALFRHADSADGDSPVAQGPAASPQNLLYGD